MPKDLVARITLISELDEQSNADGTRTIALTRTRAIAASVVVALVAVSFWVINPLLQPKSIGDDHAQLLSGVMEHFNEHPMSEVWGHQRANQSVNAILANYDGNMRFKYMQNLRFGKICPMGEYRGLHATLDTPEGQITFAYFKGDQVDALYDLTIQGYMARVKPIKGGSLVIVSKTSRGVEIADEQLHQAMTWEI